MLIEYNDGHLRIDSIGLRVYINNVEAHLTLTELRILFAIVKYAPTPISVQELTDVMWPIKSDRGNFDAVFVRTCISRIRKSIGQQYIQTTRNGYLFSKTP